MRTIRYGSAMASRLMRSSPDRAVRVRALAGDIVLCSLARHFTLTVPLSTQVYKWVPANLMLWVALRWTSPASHPGGSRNTPSRFMLQKPEISAGLMSLLVRMQTLPLPYHLIQPWKTPTCTNCLSPSPPLCGNSRARCFSIPLEVRSFQNLKGRVREPNN